MIRISTVLGSRLFGTTSTISGTLKNILTKASQNRTIHNAHRCTTTNTQFQCEYTWTIQHISMYLSDEHRNVIKSSTFSAAQNACKWFLELHTPTMEHHNTKLYLKLNDTADLDKIGPITGELQCSVLTPDGRKEETHEGYFHLDSDVTSFGFNEFISHTHDLTENIAYVQHNELRIHCSLSYIRHGDLSNVIDQYDPNVLDMSSQPMEDFAKLFNNEEFSDLTIFIRGKKYPAHKNILAVRSPVFKAMLTQDMKKKHLDRINIDDVDEKIFLEVLRFIYTGKVENIESMVFELLVVSDKYNLEILKMICENVMCRMLTVENAANLLSYSIKYNLENLKTKAIEFIRMNSKQITNSEAWKSLMSQPEAMKAVLEVYMK